MTLLTAAVGAIVAAILETSAFPELKVAGSGVDLVFLLMIVTGAVLGVEEALTWAFLGGILLDLLAAGDRPLGATTLTLLLVAGIGLLVARVTQPPRVAVVAGTAFVLSFVYQALLLAIVAATSGISLAGWSLGAFLVSAVLDGLLAAVAAWTLKSLYLRFGPTERTDW